MHQIEINAVCDLWLLTLFTRATALHRVNLTSAYKPRLPKTDAVPAWTGTLPVRDLKLEDTTITLAGLKWLLQCCALAESLWIACDLPAGPLTQWFCSPITALRDFGFWSHHNNGKQTISPSELVSLVRGAPALERANLAHGSRDEVKHAVCESALTLARDALAGKIRLRT